MIRRNGVGPAPGTIAPGRYKDLGAQQAKAEYAAAYEGGWQYDPEAMKEVIGELQGIRQDRIGDLKRLAQNITGIDPPGDEEASRGYVMDANLSGQTYEGLLDSSIDFVDAYIETLIKIDTAYRQQDEQALSELRAVGL